MNKLPKSHSHSQFPLLQNPPNNKAEESMVFMNTHDEVLNFINNNNEADCNSNCSTPYVSAPSSPTSRNDVSYYFSCPASPMHYITSSSKSPVPTTLTSSLSCDFSSTNFDFDFSARFSSSVTSSSTSTAAMSSADELFLNGKIRPMKLSSHLQKPQMLSPLSFDDIANETQEEEEANGTGFIRGRDMRMRNKSLHRRARSLSPFRNPYDDDKVIGKGLDRDEVMDSISAVAAAMAPSSTETTPSVSASSSRSSSSGRSSKRWEFLKDFLMRSKSEGRGNGKEKFWTSFAPVNKEKKLTTSTTNTSTIRETQKQKRVQNQPGAKKPPPPAAAKPSNGVGKRRNISHFQSAHEIHYKTNRAQAEEMRRKTYLPYRQGLFGCLGFSSKSYGAMNGFARALNPVSSR
ncbi:hypothetical protein MKW94_029645 [Papaver nudicaule]|uniref:Uncharacterized protein n=1 Tax=Papaver nudicaule TaxID=74823 RepID=A0AA41SGZ9_PAPNU|nr:hypothetical protein [Papaver nudicaule]